MTADSSLDKQFASFVQRSRRVIWAVLAILAIAVLLLAAGIPAPTPAQKVQTAKLLKLFEAKLSVTYAPLDCAKLLGTSRLVTQNRQRLVVGICSRVLRGVHRVCYPDLRGFFAEPRWHS